MDRHVSRLRRQKALVARLSQNLHILIFLLLIAGYSWLLILPSPRLGRGTYIDENALQPGQVNTHWNWADVHRADQYLSQLEALRDQNRTSEERAEYLKQEFMKLGLQADTQTYSFTTNFENPRGANAYAVSPSPRASGTEVMLISATWLSTMGDGDGTLNLRGVATVLALAGFLKKYSMWAKDIVYVVSDGYMDGMHAWLSAYHNSVQSNLIAEPLAASPGVIWTALNIDYPGHSFSHLGVFFEGLNGRLPNQDLFNSFQLISRHTGGVPVVLYDQIDARDQPGSDHGANTVPAWLPAFLRENAEVQEFAYRAKNIARHVSYQARGQASGVHGLMHQFRIDAITVFAVPATGPHGFHAIGRIIESTLRTTNNLLERLHASFFFYILTGPGTFLKIGSYLPAVIIISVAIMFAGLRRWVDAPQLGAKSRPVPKALLIMACTHAAGLALFYCVNTTSYMEHPQLGGQSLFLTLALLVTSVSLAMGTARAHDPALPTVLSSFNLCFASTIISVTCLLNFSLAAALAMSLGLPLVYTRPTKSNTIFSKVIQTVLLVSLGLGWLIFVPNQVRRAVWHWEVLGAWFAPFICIVYVPLLLQAATALVLSI
ncbi:Gaa1-domain-containing protein [Punctularia strigosozonata HHB-11173 SS5]|uniref:Gaa1-domain-containing protein n=1 Tax=Punctularia strigosozonata (strain HHB-11173) TaxID=741275 RepID=UPI0004417477|nr:Gaa1-domain-containing protein [Punctularia strigosozonata HHB-11173 SS5]EIN07262.1 Gaa1-domain-containing protein [Punctularia strigosozonata HHB-11173 SS5]